MIRCLSAGLRVEGTERNRVGRKLIVSRGRNQVRIPPFAAASGAGRAAEKGLRDMYVSLALQVGTHADEVALFDPTRPRLDVQTPMRS